MKFSSRIGENKMSNLVHCGNFVVILLPSLYMSLLKMSSLWGLLYYFLCNFYCIFGESFTRNTKNWTSHNTHGARPLYLCTHILSTWLQHKFQFSAALPTNAQLYQRREEFNHHISIPYGAVVAMGSQIRWFQSLDAKKIITYLHEIKQSSTLTYVVINHIKANASS